MFPEPSFMQSYSVKRKDIEGLDFILSHFEQPIWPEDYILTPTEGRQVLVYRQR